MKYWPDKILDPRGVKGVSLSQWRRWMLSKQAPSVPRVYDAQIIVVSGRQLA